MPQIVRNPKHTDRLVVRCAILLAAFDVLVHVAEWLILRMH